VTQTARAHLAMLTYSALISASFSIGDGSVCLELE